MYHSFDEPIRYLQTSFKKKLNRVKKIQVLYTFFISQKELETWRFCCKITFIESNKPLQCIV